MHSLPSPRNAWSIAEDTWKQAAAQGVSLNLGKLLGSDESVVRRVAAAFDEAAELARREGIDLRLPASTPTRARRCEFVEGGGAFVSWDGGVHPCYFLWHRYSAHVAGVVKNVAPRSWPRPMKFFSRMPTLPRTPSSVA